MRCRYSVSSIEDCSTRSNVTRPRKDSTGNSTRPNVSSVLRDVCPANASATRPADTAPRKMLVRPLDSEMVADRAVCRLKCSVVMIVTAACGFSGSDSYGCFMAPILADGGPLTGAAPLHLESERGSGPWADAEPLWRWQRLRHGESDRDPLERSVGLRRRSLLKRWADERVTQVPHQFGSDRRAEIGSSRPEVMTAERGSR